MRVLALALVVACGNPSDGLTGCWNYEMHDGAALAASGALHVRGASGDFTLSTTLPFVSPPQGGAVLASMEPNGNFALQLYVASSNRLLFEVSGTAISDPLSGAAASHELERRFDFTAVRCR